MSAQPTSIFLYPFVSVQRHHYQHFAMLIITLISCQNWIFLNHSKAIAHLMILYTLIFKIDKNTAILTKSINGSNNWRLKKYLLAKKLLSTFFALFSKLLSETNLMRVESQAQYWPYFSSYINLMVVFICSCTWKICDEYLLIISKSERVKFKGTFLVANMI